MKFLPSLILLLALAILSVTPVHADPPQLLAEARQPQVTLLHFWATWCGPCVMELPSIDRLAKDMAAKHVTVIAMSEDSGGPAAVKEFFATHPGMENIHTLYDENQAAGKKLKVDAIPTTIVIGTDGKEITRYQGSHDWDSPQMRAELAKDIVGK
jgi:thiol-disulfide isomerase/thioredoxin